MIHQKKIENWQDLKVWQLAHQLTLQIYKVTKRFPQEERFGLTSQLRRAAVSIPTNIAEGKGRGYLKEYVQFLFVARGSAEEVKYLILLSYDLEYLSEDIYAKPREDYNQVGRMLNGLLRSLRSLVP